jgi:uncharacterized protein (TIGR02246 family)
MKEESGAADRAEIRALLDHLIESWGKNDGEAYASAFSEESDYVAFDGTHIKGRAANAGQHAALFAGVLRGSRLALSGDPSVRFLTPDVAVIHMKGAVLLPWQRRIAARRLSIQTLVAVRRAGRWELAAFHNTRIRPVPTKGPALKLVTALFRLRAALSPRRG